MSLTRASVRLSTRCARTTNGFVFARDGVGSGFLVSPSTVMTADHVIRAWGLDQNGNWDGCPPNEELIAPPGSLNIAGQHTIELQWAWDREKDNGNFADARPPARWLLANRIHALSLVETGDFDPTNMLTVQEPKFAVQPATLIKSFAGNSFASNRDIALVGGSVVKVGSLSLMVPPGLFFDWLSLPSAEELLNETSHKDEKARGIHINKDPRPTSGGNWIVNFGDAGSGQASANARLPLLSGPGFFRKRTTQPFAHEACTTGYGNFRPERSRS